jgi:hypothetical protein
VSFTCSKVDAFAYLPPRVSTDPGCPDSVDCVSHVILPPESLIIPPRRCPECLAAPPCFGAIRVRVAQNAVVKAIFLRAAEPPSWFASAPSSQKDASGP